MTAGSTSKSTPLLQVRNLRTSFNTPDGKITAVAGVTFDIHHGETLGLVGESGCGKSVTALSIMQLVPNPPGVIEQGEVMFDGTDLLKLSNKEMQAVRGAGIGMIFQEPMSSLNPVLSIGRQITEPLEVHLELGKAAALDRAAELLNMVGIADSRQRLDDYPHQLSGGQRQRVMIAIALSCEPKLPIADEATTALDVTIQAQILELMKNLTSQLGTALLIITHNLGIIARYAGHNARAVIRQSFNEDPPDESTTTHPLDSAWLAGLESLGLRSSAEADAFVLARRVHIDLAGRPPTPDELDAFIALPPARRLAKR